MGSQRKVASSDLAHHLLHHRGKLDGVGKGHEELCFRSDMRSSTLALTAPPCASLWAVLALALTFAWRRAAGGSRGGAGTAVRVWRQRRVLGTGFAPCRRRALRIRLGRRANLSHAWLPGLAAVPLLWAFGDSMPVVYAPAAECAFGTAAVAAVYWLATTLFDRRTGLLAALAAAIYPSAIGMSVVVLSECAVLPVVSGSTRRVGEELATRHEHGGGETCGRGAVRVGRP